MSRLIEKAFSSYKIGGLVLPNRIIRASMFEPFCPDGVISQEFIDHHKEFILGGAGMVTTGIVHVDPRGCVSPFQLSVRQTPMLDLFELTEQIHDLGGKISMQLSFVGTSHDLFNPSSDWFALQYDHEELEELKHQFIEVAAYAESVGFDAIELHHFFLSQFFRKEINQRTDSYGGESLENRVKYPVEICQGIRDVVSTEFPVFAKLSMHEGWYDDGDLLFIADSLVSDGGVDSIVAFRPLSAGVEDCSELYALEPALKLQDQIDVPIVYSCGVENEKDLEVIMDNFELVQIGRSILRDPELPNKIKNGVEVDECIKCNGCYGSLFDIKKPNLRCVLRN